MKTRFHKLAIASAVTAAVAGVSLPAQAIVTGIAGEALLVPLTIWDNNRGWFGRDLNTLIEIEVPASVGEDDVANIWMAPHTTPIDPLTDPDTYDPDAFKSIEEVGPKVAFIHWFVFNSRSKHLKNDEIKVTPNDIVQINFRELMGGDLEGQPTYMVITNESSFRNPKNGATFAMFGDAWLVDGPFGLLQAQIPVLPMSDGPDTTKVPVFGDHVVYPNGLPIASPLASGNLMNYADGEFEGGTVFDVPLSSNTWWGNSFTYHVLWRDLNVPETEDQLKDILLGGNFTTRDNPQIVDLQIYDSDEKGCSDEIELWDELEIICWEPQGPFGIGPFPFLDWCRNGPWFTGPLGRLPPLPATAIKYETCFTNEADANGFVSYRFPELWDAGTRSAETAGLMFSIMNRTIGTIVRDNDDDIFVEMALGRYRGWYPEVY